MINEGDVNFGANWGVCDSRTIRLKRISRTYPWDLEDVPDFPFPFDLGLGPLTQPFQGAFLSFLDFDSLSKRAVET